MKASYYLWRPETRVHDNCQRAITVPALCTSHYSQERCEPVQADNQGSGILGEKRAVQNLNLYLGGRHLNLYIKKVLVFQ
jgi:hypothetical protein